MKWKNFHRHLSWYDLSYRILTFLIVWNWLNLHRCSDVMFVLHAGIHTLRTSFWSMYRLIETKQMQPKHTHIYHSWTINALYEFIVANYKFIKNCNIPYDLNACESFYILINLIYLLIHFNLNISMHVH